MSEKLERLKLKRRGQRGTVTKNHQEANSLLEAEKLEPSGIRRLTTIQRLLEEKRVVLKGLDEEIIDTCPLNEVEQETIEAEEISELIVECIEQIKAVIETKSEVTKELTDQTRESQLLLSRDETVRTNNDKDKSGAPADDKRSGSPPATVNKSLERSELPVTLKPRLPKIELPKFNGNITKFRSFWESYESSVDLNPSLSTIDKFNYLRASLEGSAARSIQGLSLTEGNYAAATEILKKRFGKPQQVIVGHMDDLMKIPPCSSDRTSHLRLVYDRVYANVRGLEALGMKSDQYGSFLIPVVMDKLPDDVRLQIARVTTKDVWEIEELLEVLSAEIEAREISEGIRVHDSRSSNANSSQKHKSDRTTASAMLTRDTGNITCVYCKENHYSASCHKVATIVARREVLRKEGRCYVCLMRGHRSNECQSQRKCRKCGRRHHQSLCEQDCPPPPPANDDTKETIPVTTSNVAKTKNHVLLQTARSRAYSADDHLVPVRVLLDSGSQRSYITNSLKAKLKLVPLGQERLALNTFGSTGCKRENCDIILVTLQGKRGEDVEIKALSFPAICSPLQTEVDVDQHPHLMNLDLADERSDDGYTDSIDVLIGSDFYWSVVIGDIIRGDSGPVALNSHLGWLVSGPTKSLSVTSTVSTLIIDGCDHVDRVQCSDSQLTQELSKFWETESIGITGHKSCTTEQFPPEILFNWKDGRYQIGLPWKSDVRPLSDCHSLCVDRLNQLYKRLSKKEPILREYDEIICKQLADGIIERVPHSEEKLSDCHFLPHHGVVREDKETTKLRVVFDGSAKDRSNDLSLNDCLEKGPNTTPHIFDILLKFRRYTIGIVSDVEKAFHQIVVTPKDRNMLKFLWYDDISNRDPQIIQYRFCRLVFGLTPSPAILSETIHHHVTRYLLTEPEIAEILASGFYVDDFTTGTQTVDKGFDVYKKAKQLMCQGGFNLRKWKTNSKILQGKINLAEGEDSETHEVKLLGVRWNTELDTFQFDFKEVTEFVRSLPPTKRSILRISAKVFDPLGLLSPFVIKTKILFQTLCKSKLEWDSTLEGEMLHQWKHLLEEYDTVSEISIPRCYVLLGENTIVSQQLHGFSDASVRAYAAVVYLRTEYENGHVRVCLVSSKTRVSPLKEQTIPRLELLGATILSRLIFSIREGCGFNYDTYCWTDSLTVLCWVKNSKPWKQYVKNRVEEIRTLTDMEHWRFCPGNENPADLPSRSCQGRELIHNNLWWEGPKFLKESARVWPNMPTRYDSSEAQEEQMKSPPEVIHSLPTLTTAKDTLNLEDIIDINKYSSKLRLLKVTALVVKFVACLKPGPRRRALEVTATELKEAECLWVQSIQRSTFTEEYRWLLAGDTVVYKSQLILMLNDQHLICCKGRLNQSDLPDDTKNPILLPTKHRFTELLIMERHNSVHHNGIPETLAAVRDRYWIVKGRVMVKKIIRRCIVCRRYDGRPFPSPIVPDLPAERVSDAPPFSTTGIDFAGPLYIRNSDSKECNCKVYVCLFTCASTRAVHLELTRELSATSFLLAFRRFCGRRGLPLVIMSDNAKTFKHCSKEIVSIARAEEVRSHLTNKQIEWRFIVEKAPWWGGYWERLIQSVKRCLRKTVGKSTLTFDELATILTEIESTLNNRPLTYLYSDDEGPYNAVAPADLIYGHRIASTSSNQQYEVVSTAKSLTKRAKYQGRILNNFINQWKKDYLLSLQERRDINRPSSNGREIKEGDVVILKEEGTARCLWKLAKIIETIKGRDGAIRSAKIQLMRGDRRVNLRRPIQHLVPLEAED